MDHNFANIGVEKHILDVNLELHLHDDGQSLFTRMCRLCMAEEVCTGTSMVDIFLNGSVLATIISSITELVVSNADGLPSNICKNCINQLNMAHDFKQRCIATDITLRKLYSKDSAALVRLLPTCHVAESSSSSLFEPQIKLETILSSESRSINSGGTEVSDEQSSDGAKGEEETEHFRDADSSLKSRTKSRFPHDGDGTKRQLFLCSSCKKTFFHQESLIEHLRTHTTESRYKCMICERMFSRKDVLTRHTRTHTGEQPYRCEACNKSFAQKETLVRHFRTHSGHQPYQCTVCGKAFSQKSHLNTHMWSHSNEKSFRCDVCGKHFTLKPSLTRHMRTHQTAQDFRCTVCDRFFVRRSTLASHMRGHTGEYPYQCEVCMMTFSLRASLTRHFQTHVQHHIYQCKICLKGFTRKDTLTRHMLTH